MNSPRKRAKNSKLADRFLTDISEPWIHFHTHHTTRIWRLPRCSPPVVVAGLCNCQLRNLSVRPIGKLRRHIHAATTAQCLCCVKCCWVAPHNWRSSSTMLCSENSAFHGRHVRSVGRSVVYIHQLFMINKIISKVWVGLGFLFFRKLTFPDIVSQ